MLKIFLGSLPSFLFLFVIFACEKTEEKSQLVDYDGHIYETAKFGNQEWMTENLKVTHYRDGTPISHVTNGIAWTALTSEAYSIYNNNTTEEVNTYGALYNWHAVIDTRILAPSGWHIPTDTEWKELELHLGMSQNQVDSISWRGTDQGSMLAGNADLWKNGALQNNPKFGNSGFNAIAGGYRNFNTGTYDLIGENAYFWSFSEHVSNKNNAWVRILGYDNSEVNRGSTLKGNGFAIRCIRD
jgi:uncharacterized protein (TIGR02145 family)